MSVHSSPAGEPSASSHSGIAAEDLFETVIQSDEAICSRCFRRKRVAVPILVPVDDENGGNREVREDYVGLLDDGAGTPKAAYLTFDSTQDVDVCFPPPAGDEGMPAADRRACPRARTVCECGAIDADANRPPLSTEDALEHVERISKRLDEEDIDHDPERLRDLIRKGKSRPSLACRDDDLFAKAVEFAVDSDHVSHETARDRLLATAD